jgi:hypothetical protein
LEIGEPTQADGEESEKESEQSSNESDDDGEQPECDICDFYRLPSKNGVSKGVGYG